MKTNYEILHCMDVEPKFMQSFIDLIKENFDYKQHKFILREHSNNVKIDIDSNTVFLPKYYSKIKRIIYFSYYMNRADKIILHGLFHKDIIFSLFFQPWLLKKCYHAMWGGDFYFPEHQSWIKKRVIKKMGNFITHIKGDYDLCQKWYGSRGMLHESFMYPSNLYKEYEIGIKEDSYISIQLGNSANPTNNHLEILEKLAIYKNSNIKIFTPLSYSGNELYIKEVIKKGKELFEKKFIPLTEFIPFENYLEFLSKIDIAIFAHNRQQAIGNINMLLGLGKKVYMDNNLSSSKFFQEINVKVFDITNINIDLIDEKIKKNNQIKIKTYFSKENLLKQLKELFQ